MKKECSIQSLAENWIRKHIIFSEVILKEMTTLRSVCPHKGILL